MQKQSEKQLSKEETWIAPRLAFLDKLIASARKDGRHPDGQEEETIDKLKIYISKALPGSDKLRAKLEELHYVLYGHSNYSMNTADNLYIAYHNDPDWPDVDKIKRRLEEETKRQDEELDQTPPSRLYEHPAFQRKLTIDEEAKEASVSIKTVIDFMDKYYGDITDDGIYKILNFRVPGKMQEMTRKHFMESTEAWSITITAEGSTSPKVMSFAQLWLKHSPKRSWDQFVFDPSYEFDPVTMRKGDFNLWPGFAYKPKKGNCWRFLRFVRDIICNGNREHCRWLLAWLAQIVQHPEFKPGTAVVLIGKKGAGKSFFGKKIRKLLGPEICFKTAKRDDLFGKWSDHLGGKIFTQLEEAIWAGNKQEMSELNEFITGDTMSIQTRFKSTKQSQSYIRFLLNANPGDGAKNWVIPATFDERRYSALYISEAQMNRKVEYFDPIDEELENGGYEALMYFLKHFPIERYNLNKGLQTQALMDQMNKTAMSDKSVKGWWIRYTQICELPYVDVVDETDRSVAPRFLEDKSGNHVFEPTGRVIEDPDEELVGEYYYVGKKRLRQEYAKSIGKKVEEIDEVAFGLEFNSLFPELDENGNIVMINEGRRAKSILREGKTKKKPRMNIYKIPKSSVVRNLLNKVVGNRIDWEDAEKNWEQKEFE